MPVKSATLWSSWDKNQNLIAQKNGRPFGWPFSCFKPRCRLGGRQNSLFAFASAFAATFSIATFAAPVTAFAATVVATVATFAAALTGAVTTFSAAFAGTVTAFAWAIPTASVTGTITAVARAVTAITGIATAAIARPGAAAIPWAATAVVARISRADLRELVRAPILTPATTGHRADRRGWHIGQQ